MKTKTIIPTIISIAAAVIIAVATLILFTGFLVSLRTQAAPLRNPGTGRDPEIRYVTMTTSQIPNYDPTDNDGVTKTVYFSNSVSGGVTMTFDISGTHTLTLTSGAAFNEPARVYTSSQQTWIQPVTYTIVDTHTTQYNIAYTTTNTESVQTRIAITYVRDITAPTSHIAYPTKGQYISGTQLVITGTANDAVSGGRGSGVKYTQISTNTDADWQAVTSAVDWTYTWTLPIVDSEPYTLSARAGDNLGIWQQVPSTAVITVDTVAPIGAAIITSNLPICQWTNRNRLNAQWDGFTDGGGIAGYQYIISDTAPLTLPLAGSAFTTTPNITETLKDGEWYFHIAAQDEAGNWSTTDYTGLLHVDVTPPTATISTPTPGTVLTSALSSFPVTGAAVDTTSGISQVQVTTGTMWATAASTETWTYTWTLPAIDAMVYTLTAQAADKAANIGPSADVAVTVDTVAPTATAPTPDRSPWITSTVVYTWPDSTDRAGITRYLMNITNTSGYSTVLSPSDQALTFTQAFTEGAGYSARVRAVDNNGNVGDWSNNSSVVTPDLTAPTNVAITAPEHISATRFILSWSAEDATSGVASYTVEYSSTSSSIWRNWLTNTTAVSKSFQATETKTDYAFRVTAYDRVGNKKHSDKATTHVGAFSIYLPLTLRNYAPFTNGSFEAGLTGWQIQESPLPVSSVSNIQERPSGFTLPADGEKAILLGDTGYPCNGVPLGQATVEQFFNVPKNAATLTFKYIIWSQDTSIRSEYDRFEVYIDSTLVFSDGNQINTGLGCDKWRRVPGPDNPRNGITNEWAEETIDISSYQDQNITISFRNYSRYDNYYNTYTYIDDVRIEE